MVNEFPNIEIIQKETLNYYYVHPGFFHSKNNNINKRYHSKQHGKIARNGENTLQNPEDSFYKCGTKGQLSKTFKTPEHISKLHKKS